MRCPIRSGKLKSAPQHLVSTTTQGLFVCLSTRLLVAPGKLFDCLFPSPSTQLDHLRSPTPRHNNGDAIPNPLPPFEADNNGDDLSPLHPSINSRSEPVRPGQTNTTGSSLLNLLPKLQRQPAPSLQCQPTPSAYASPEPPHKARCQHRRHPRPAEPQHEPQKPEPSNTTEDQSRCFIRRRRAWYWPCSQRAHISSWFTAVKTGSP